MIIRIAMMVGRALLTNVLTTKISDYYKTKFKFYSKSKQISIVAGLLSATGGIGWFLYEFFPWIIPHLF